MAAAQQDPKIVIHRCEHSDIARLDLMIAGMNASKSAGYFERQLTYQTHGKRDIYIVQVDGVDAGYCILNWDPKYPLFRKAGIPEIQDLNILKTFRQQGIATALILFCEELVQKKDYAHIGISVSVSARFGPAQRLYTKLGYMPDGYGVTYDRKNAVYGEMRPVDDQLCMMMVKTL